MIHSSAQPGARYALLDELRGFCLIGMMLYHGLWDLVYLYGASIPWYTGTPGHVWQQIICCTFILLSGFCLALGHHPVRRGLIVFASGALVTLVTWLFMPADLVLFGVLTFLGSAMIVTGLLRRWLERVPAWLGFAVSVVLFVVTKEINSGFFGFEGLVLGMVPAGLYANNFTAFLGFPQPWFYSTDYFSLFPWLFLFWAGFFLHQLVGKERMAPLGRSVCLPLGWMGRHSLVIYLLHQPVIYGILSLGALLL